ncbi:MAG: type IV pilin N-terminal domain-containing protein, partial [Methanoregula sp.]|nr:type IV pilin N-terminal domain-containing protein [Methanoregula sp.]
MNHPPDSERAISDVFGAVILIGVIVTVFAVAGVMMFSQPQPQKIPALNALISTNAQTIDIHHGGGDAFNFADI